MRRSLGIAAALVVLTDLACTSHVSGSGGSSQGVASSTGESVGAGSAGGSTGTGTSGAPQGSTGTTTGGTSSGGATGRPLVDGGYVFCHLANAADAGPNGDGGSAGWLCRPGTYFCDLGGDIGNCFQCRNDGDCNDTSLPTYDSNRRHCDLTSGVSGYQGFCQECLIDADCDGNPAGPRCDPDAGGSKPNIDLVGFETCEPTPAPGPPDCTAAAYLVDGGCIPSFMCTNDQECVGLISREQFPTPFCVGGSCTSCQAGICQGVPCDFDTDCANAYGADAGSACNTSFHRCGCTSDAQCGGFWPLCMGLDGGLLDSMDQLVGLCGCDSDGECGDGGLRCLGPQSGSPGQCEVPCADPRLPSCLSFEGPQLPYCDPFALTCAGCGSDSQCKASGVAQLTGPYCRLDGACGCQTSSDCPNGRLCQPPLIPSSVGGDLGLCETQPQLCTPPSCDGVCGPDGGCEPGAQCVGDYDCAVALGADISPFCDVDAGVCEECSGDSDCVKAGFAALGKSYCGPRLACIQGCMTDQDCVGNSSGPSCVTNGSSHSCGCGTDKDCASSPLGGHCDSNANDVLYGSCICLSVSECAPGFACQLQSGSTAAQCGNSCASDTGCPSGFFCDPVQNCRPRCDTGKSCLAPDTVCDTDNEVGRNGEPESEGGAVWCYQCLSGTDCPAGVGCSAYAGHTCATCFQSSDCRPGETCFGGACHAGCDTGTCPAGQMCDSLDLAGGGLGVCYQCLGPLDCPAGEGCESTTQTCGTCDGPTANGGPFDCPPDAICSNYWSAGKAPGVCLQNCDDAACPSGLTCEVFSSLTPDHKYCFGCLQDSDCGDAGPGAWCDLSVGLTFTCQPGQ